MTKVNEIRKALKGAGLKQWHDGDSRSFGGTIGYGDFSVREQLNTTYSRFGVGYKIKRKSVKTGKIEIKVMFSAEPNTAEKIKIVLDSMGIPFEGQTGNFVI